MLQSMTGFSRVEGGDATAKWVWELRSVNGKTLDMRFKMPAGFEHLEPAFRETVAGSVKRGNIQISLQLDAEGSNAVPVLNEAAFDAAIAMVKSASERSGLAMPGLETIFAIKGVMEISVAEKDKVATDLRNLSIVDSLKSAAKALAVARRSEGAAIAQVLIEQIAQIERLTQAIKADPSRSAESIRAKLQEQLARLTDGNQGLDSLRLHQEAAILATKADLQEEIDRLEAHCVSARQLLKEGDAVGRKLDFLSQEFNRECNTICSKSNAASVTHAGLEMKVIIDQFREQIQNIQ